MEGEVNFEGLGGENGFGEVWGQLVGGNEVVGWVDI